MYTLACPLQSLYSHYGPRSCDVENLGRSIWPYAGRMTDVITITCQGNFTFDAQSKHFYYFLWPRAHMRIWYQLWRGILRYQLQTLRTKPMISTAIHSIPLPRRTPRLRNELTRGHTLPPHYTLPARTLVPGHHTKCLHGPYQPVIETSEFRLPSGHEL